MNVMINVLSVYVCKWLLSGLSNRAFPISSANGKRKNYVWRHHWRLTTVVYIMTIALELGMWPSGLMVLGLLSLLSGNVPGEATISCPKETDETVFRKGAFQL